MSTEVNPTTVTSGLGVRIDSSEPITDSEREYLASRAKPIPPDAKPGEAKPEKRVKVEAVDTKGREHAEDGKFKGKGAKPEEAPEKQAKAEPAEKADDAKSDKTPEEKRDAQTRIRDLAEKKNQESERANREAQRAEKAERELAKLKAERERPAEPKAEPEPKAKGRPRVQDFDNFEEYQAADDAYLEAKATEIADKRVDEKLAAIEREREAEEREQTHSKRLRESVEAADKAIAEAGGAKFLEKVRPTMSRIVPSFEAERLGIPVAPIHVLGDYVLLAGKQSPRVQEYLHENPDIVDRFEQIGRLPTSRQPEAVDRELAMLHGAMRALYKSKASVTTDNPEPDAASFKPRAQPPPPSVQGSPAVAEPDLSKIDDFGEYMRAKGKRPRGTPVGL